MQFDALVIGSSSRIAQAVIAQLSNQNDCRIIYTVSQFPPRFFSQKVRPLLSNYSQESIEEICQYLQQHTNNLTKVIICNGVLHNTQYTPEKKLEDIQIDQLAGLYRSNAIVPMIWLSRLIQVLKGKRNTQVALFSARVGSISDNKIGGWYGYRASKAALNMLIQTSAIEYARRAKNVKLMAFHPGTTDTPLSKPFQKSVPEGKLFTPKFVAQRLLSIMDNAKMDNQASFIDWDNKKIEW
ncbi:C-factor [Marinomonas spartinae]|uniref:C-factor n=1 Tax=Marinomonas spartinae TaxID=1792290 RepID=A0A1A8T5R7_9GAMM|nr:SDR family NAD(P)-dependent oxidoreductase [Marinomonas spartinae]SBS27726.1 C-factor [Marinomonas spartinae]SBS30140.1 C-factor [Marinomonas spartinae]